MVNKCSVWVKRSVWPGVKVGRGLSVGSIIQQPLNLLAVSVGGFMWKMPDSMHVCSHTCELRSFFCKGYLNVSMFRTCRKEMIPYL